MKCPFGIVIVTFLFVVVIVLSFFLYRGYKKYLYLSDEYVSLVNDSYSVDTNISNNNLKIEELNKNLEDVKSNNGDKIRMYELWSRQNEKIKVLLN